MIADLYLQGDINHPSIKECAVFTRCLSWNSYIRDSFDSTLAPEKYKELYYMGVDHLDPESSDEHNMIMLGADFTEDDDMPGYMEGAVRIANRKVNKCILPKL